jgi:thiol:disulfide interchange protein DsbG
MIRLFKILLVVGFMIMAHAPVNARAQDTGGVPEMPEPLQELVNQGAQVRYLGKDYGLDSWITIKNGQEQYFYVLPDKSAFMMGVLFDSKGKLVTVQQVQRLQAQGDTLLDSLATGFGDVGAEKDARVDAEFKTPSERLFNDITLSNWVPLGQAGAPVAYVFIDPQCPHCHEFIKDLRADYLDKGRIQLRIIPVGFKEETVAQAAFLLAAPDPQDRWYKHMDGDATALPAKADINQQGVQRNLALMQSWKFDVTPMVIYRGKDGTVKIVRGRAKDIPAFINDLGARS